MINIIQRVTKQAQGILGIYSLNRQISSYKFSACEINYVCRCPV